MQLALIVPIGGDVGLPPQIWPGPHPGHPLPTPPQGPTGGTPQPPIALPPGQPWPPLPANPIVPPNAPPGSVWPPLPPGGEIPSGKALVVVYVSGHGMRYAVVDFGLTAQPK